MCTYTAGLAVVASNVKKSFLVACLKVLVLFTPRLPAGKATTFVVDGGYVVLHNI